jgi:hypothetical protein
MPDSIMPPSSPPLSPPPPPPPLNYQWLFNGANISNATNSLLVLTNVPLTAAGNYLCIVTNNAGSAASQSRRVIC